MVPPPTSAAPPVPSVPRVSSSLPGMGLYVGVWHAAIERTVAIATVVMRAQRVERASVESLDR